LFAGEGVAAGEELEWAQPATNRTQRAAGIDESLVNSIRNPLKGAIRLGAARCLGERAAFFTPPTDGCRKLFHCEAGRLSSMRCIRLISVV
jgi:hypothetical protein